MNTLNSLSDKSGTKQAQLKNSLWKNEGNRWQSGRQAPATGSISISL